MIHKEVFQKEILTFFPREFLITAAIAPLREENGSIVIFGAKESEGSAVEAGLALKKSIKFIEADELEVRRFVSEHYGLETSRQEAIDEFGDRIDNIKSLEEQANDAPLVRLVSDILMNACRKRASDIHIEPHEDATVIRFRIDGVLAETDRLPLALNTAIVSRIKILSRLDIAQTRLPQDGRVALNVGGRELDLRVSTIPTPHGERVVLRLLDRSSVRFGMEELGLDGALLSKWKDTIFQPHGIVLVTGPTGSGKTTTLYAAIETLRSGKVNILTVEDPVEYQLDGIGQIQVNPKINLTFAAGLRSILRQDPDIIMVGEIRDDETALIAVQSALTGHLVLSTLHTNDSASASPRLLDMNIEPYLLASTLRGVLAQRLVRRLCQNCMLESKPNEIEIASLGLMNGEKIFRAKGCDKCDGSGYHGRIGIFEFMATSDKIRELILNRRPSSEIFESAYQSGMKSMKDDGVGKIRAGLTSPEEVIRVTEAPVV